MVAATDKPGALGRDVLISTVSAVALLLLSFGNNVLIARLSGPEGRGLYAIAVSVFAVAWPVATIGTPVAVVHHMGRRLSAPEARGLGLLGAAGLAALMVTAAFLTITLGVDLGGVPPTVLAWIALGVPAVCVFEYGRAVLLGERRVPAYNAAHLTMLMVVVLGNAVTLRGGAPLARPVHVLVAASWFIAFVIAWDQLRHGVAWPERGDVVAMLRFGRCAAVTRLSETGLVRADYLLLPALIPMEAVGVYAIADQLAQVFAFFGITTGRMLLAESARDVSGTRSAVKLARASRVLVAVSLAVVAVGAASFGWLIPLVFGEPFADAYLGFLLLAPALVGRGISSVLGPYLEGQGAQRPVVRAGVLALMVDLVLLAALVPAMGWYGAAVAKSLAYLVQLGMLLAACPEPARAAGMWRLRMDDVRSVWDVVSSHLPRRAGGAA